MNNAVGKIIRSPLFIITVLICAANWQLLFCVKSLQWDMINFWYPWRHFIAQCYNNGLIPLWDPYTQAGYPVHGDLQGPAYNPETIISSFLFNGSLYYLNYLFIGYLILGAYGFYKLCILFSQLVKGSQDQQHLTGATVAGIIYSLSGYNTGFGHYLYVTVSVCLIPWLYYYVLKILRNGTFTDSCKLAVFVFMQVTAGNPSFLIVSGYFFILIVAIQFIKWFRLKQSAKVVLACKQYGASVIIIVLLCLPVVINAYYIFPETTRGKGISLAWAAEERFAFRNFLTFFTPLISNEREYQAGANQPIFSFFIGITTIFFAIVGFVKYRSYWAYVFTGIAIISFVLSIGLRTPVFGWFHSYMPFFNVFRMPRLIFLYCEMFLLLLASLGINYFLNGGKVPIKWFLFFFLFCILSGLVSVIYFNYFYSETGTYVVDHSSVRYYLWSESQLNKALISFGTSVIGLIAAMILYKHGKYRSILVVLLVEVMVNFNLNAITRNYSETKASVTNSYIKEVPTAFACPENIATGKVASLTRHFNELWLNAGIFIKQPAYSNDNNFELSNYMKLYNNDQSALKYFTKQPLAFLADSFVTKIDDSASQSKKALVLLDSLTFLKYLDPGLSLSTSDTILFKKFEPQHFLFETRSTGKVGFVLQQNLSKLWHIYIDGGEIKPDTCYYSFPLIKLSEGVHAIEFKYQVPHYRLYFGLSLALFIICMLLILYRFKMRWPALAIFAMVVLFCSFKFYKGNANRETEKLNELQQAVLNDEEFKGDNIYVMNTRDVYFSEVKDVFTKYNFIYPEDVASLAKKMEKSGAKYLYYVTYKTYSPPEVDATLEVIFGPRVKKTENEFGSVSIYKNEPRKQYLLYEKNFNLPVANPAGVEVKKGKEYSPTFEFILKDIKAEKYDLVFAEAEIECGFDDFKGLCISIDNNGRNKKFLAYNFVHHPALQKQSLSFYYRLPENTKPSDVVKVFVWNDDERPLLLKDLKMKVISKVVFDH